MNKTVNQIVSSDNLARFEQIIQLINNFKNTANHADQLIIIIDLISLSTLIKATTLTTTTTTKTIATTTSTTKSANTSSIMYPYGTGVYDTLVPKNDEGPLDLGVPFAFFNKNYSAIYGMDS